MPSKIHVGAGQPIKQTNSVVSFMKSEPGREQRFSALMHEEKKGCGCVCACMLLTYCIHTGMHQEKEKVLGVQLVIILGFTYNKPQEINLLNIHKLNISKINNYFKSQCLCHFATF